VQIDNEQSEPKPVEKLFPVQPCPSDKMWFAIDMDSTSITVECARLGDKTSEGNTIRDQGFTEYSGTITSDPASADRPGP